jgi:hypothetical protein
VVPRADLDNVKRTFLLYRDSKSDPSVFQPSGQSLNRRRYINFNNVTTNINENIDTLTLRIGLSENFGSQLLTTHGGDTEYIHVTG